MYFSFSFLFSFGIWKKERGCSVSLAVILGFFFFPFLCALLGHASLSVSKKEDCSV